MATGDSVTATHDLIQQVRTVSAFRSKSGTTKIISESARRRAVQVELIDRVAEGVLRLAAAVHVMVQAVRQEAGLATFGRARPLRR